MLPAMPLLPLLLFCRFISSAAAAFLYYALRYDTRFDILPLRRQPATIHAAFAACFRLRSRHFRYAFFFRFRYA